MFLQRSHWPVIMIVALLLVTCLPAAALGDVESKPVAEPEISMDKAIDMALTNSEAYRIAKISVREKEELALYAAESMSDNTSLYAYLAAELNYNVSKMSRDQAADQVRNTVVARYGAVLVDQAELASALSDQLLAEQEYRIAKAQYNAGVLSSLDFEAIKQNYGSNDTVVETARANLNSSYTSLNTLIGLNVSSRPVLIDETEYAEIKVDNLESEVNRVLGNAPSVYQAEQQALLKEYEINTLGWYGSYRPYQARLAELKQAKLNVTAQREAMAAQTRGYYYAILEVEENYQKLMDASAALRLTAQKQQAYYDAGMCTRYDLEKALNDVKSYDAQLASLKWSHTNLLNSLATPWAAAN